MDPQAVAGPLIIKGILDVEDARSPSARSECDRGLQSWRRHSTAPPSSIAMLPKIAMRGGHTEVLFDGGVRSGQDVLRALALGAKACLIGRAYI